MDTATIRDWLAAFAGKSGKANVVFLGGEPTLHPGLPDAVRAARELGYNSVTIDTNGYLFHDILRKIGPDQVDFISFSLDGATRGTNDMLRGQGSYETCVAGIRNAIRGGFDTSLIYTVSSQNLHELEMMPPILGDLGIRRFFIQVIGIRGKSASGDHAPSQVTREQWLGIVPEAAQRAAEHGMVVSYPKVYLSPGEPFECAGVCAENYFIFPNGRVYRCPLCEDYPLHGFVFQEGKLASMPKINETDLFALNIPEGCVMNKLIQPRNISYAENGTPEHRIACCMLKEEISV